MAARSITCRADRCSQRASTSRVGSGATRQDTLFNFEEKGYMVLPPPRTNATPTGFYDVFPNGGFAVLSRTAGTDSTRSSVIALLNWQEMLKQGAARER